MRPRDVPRGRRIGTSTARARIRRIVSSAIICRRPPLPAHRRYGSEQSGDDSIDRRSDAGFFAERHDAAAEPRKLEPVAPLEIDRHRSPHIRRQAVDELQPLFGVVRIERDPARSAHVHHLPHSAQEQLARQRVRADDPNRLARARRARAQSDEKDELLPRRAADIFAYLGLDAGSLASVKERRHAFGRRSVELADDQLLQRTDVLDRAGSRDRRRDVAKPTGDGFFSGDLLQRVIFLNAVLQRDDHTFWPEHRQDRPRARLGIPQLYRKKNDIDDTHFPGVAGSRGRRKRYVAQSATDRQAARHDRV